MMEYELNAHVEEDGGEKCVSHVSNKKARSKVQGRNPHLPSYPSYLDSPKKFGQSLLFIPPLKRI